MSLTLNMVGGGGGGLKATDAILRVIAPALSTVTITKGAVSKTDVGHENAIDPTLYDYYFIIHQSQFDSVNAWTVTATLSGETASDTIIIDAADEYDVSLAYNLYLFHDGAYGITLDYVRSNTSDNSTASMTIDNSMLHLYLKYNSGQTGATYQYGAANAVDVTDYSSMVCEVSNGDGSGSVVLGLYSSKSGAGTSNAYVYKSGILYSETVTLDISSVTGTAYPAFRIWCGTSNTRNVYISDWYLAR